jgi:hypothetical protein
VRQYVFRGPACTTKGNRFAVRHPQTRLQRQSTPAHMCDERRMHHRRVVLERCQRTIHVVVT